MRTKLRPIQAEANRFGDIVFDACGTANIEAASEENTGGSLSILAYNGGALRVNGYDAPVHVDLDGLSGIDGSAKLPVLRNHDKDRPIGVVTAQRVGNTIQASGKLTGQSDDRREVEAMAADGYEWQASIGAHPTHVLRVRKGARTEVNGQAVEGPAYIARKASLREITLLTIGADAGTEVTIAAELGDDEGEQTPPPIQGDSSGGLAEIKIEKARRKAIEAAAIELIKKGGDCDAIESAMNDAITAGQTAQQFELSLLRNHAFSATPITSGSRDDLTGEMHEQCVEAALCKELNFSTEQLEAQFSERVLNTMDRHPTTRNGFGLKDLLIHAAHARGQRNVSPRNVEAMLRGAFGPIEARGSSTFDLSGVLSNVANKTIRQHFMAVSDLKPVSGSGGMQAYRVLGAVGSVSDFKQHTRYSLTGDMTYEEIGNDGELKHATVGELSYTNQAETYGKIMAITRKHIINDDLNAFGQIGRRLGRGAALKLAEVFWAAFLNNSSSFSTSAVTTKGQQAAANYFEGASTNLQLSSLTTAETMFLEAVDPDGKPLGVMPEILLVPPAEMSNAAVLMSSQLIVSGNTSKTPNANPHAGKYRGYTSPYMSNANYTGYSAVAWYLMANPMDLPFIETVFYNGRETPTIESTQADFDMLGVQFRGFHDFGVGLQETRGIVKSKGAA